jgi:hypothetical protein
MLNHPDFLPAGPLVYLVMDRKGGSKLGLYERRETGNLAPAPPYLGREVIFWPGLSELDQCMKEEITLFGLLNNCPRTRTDHSSLSTTADYLIRFLCWLLFNKRFSKLKFHLAYPNYYYVYREMVGGSVFESSAGKIINDYKTVD